MILLTGATGYLGRHVMERLRQRRIDFVPTTSTLCDLTSARETWTLLERVNPSCVIHCAAVVPKCEAEYHNRAAGDASDEMVRNVVTFAQCPVVFASSMTAHRPTTEYASAKWVGEVFVSNRNARNPVLRLPGLFGLPRTSGVIYDAAKAGVIPESFGPYPAMHVTDAAEYMVRAAAMPHDGDRTPFNVVYGDPRLEACYGSLGVTFNRRVQELVEQVKQERVNV